MESRVSMDASGVPPRTEGTPRTEQVKIEFAPEPPLNWRLNVLLEEIASSIDNTELDRIKILFRGPNGLGKRTLESCDTFTKLFDVLRERCFISRGNMVYLNKILYTLDRPDLIEKAVGYCRKEGNGTQYYKEELNDNGCRSIKLHVVVDIGNIDLETIERLRNNVAKIVCAPAESIRVEAVEPGSSLLVTLLIPAIYVTILQKLLVDESDLWELTAVGVDTVVIADKSGDKSYNLTGIHGTEIVETDQQRKVMNIYEQLEQSRQELTNTELQAIERMKEIHMLESELQRNKEHENDMKIFNETLERKNMELLAACSLLQRMRLPSPDGKAAMFAFKKVMSEANHRRQDMTVIKQIVDANTLVVSAYIRNSNEAERKQKEAILEQRRLEETEILHQLITQSITAETALYTKYARYTLDVPITLNETILNTMKEVSRLVTDGEREHLMELYNWEENDLIKTCIELDTSLLLTGLDCKEAEKTQKCVQSDIFVSRLLKEVNRADLEDMYGSLFLEFRVQQNQQDVFWAQTAERMQSLHQSAGLGQPTVNEVQQIRADTTATLDIVKQVHTLLKGSSTDEAAHTRPDLRLRPFQSRPRPHSMSFAFVSDYSHRLRRAMEIFRFFISRD